MQKNVIVGIGVVIGLGLLVLTYVYATTQAQFLPHYFPGYEMVAKIHYKHAIGCFVLAMGCFTLAWFQSGKKSA